jgi:F420-dependent oxidoreductase-like protein
VRHSFKIWAQQTDWKTLSDCWVEADRGGFWDMVWLNDHLYPPKAPAELPIMEAWTLFGGLAAITDRLRFGTMVTSNTFRHPAVLAKQITTLDHMSGGRIEVGLGAGWHQAEHHDYDIPLPPLTERFDRLEETLAILHGLFTEDVFTFDGAYRHIRGARFEPKPVQKPRPPFVIGGAGPKRTIPMAARWADQWNYPDFNQDFDLLERSLEVFRSSLAAIGRDRSDIELSIQFRYPNDESKMKEWVAAYTEYGADHLLVSFSPGTDTAIVPKVAEALGR